MRNMMIALMLLVIVVMMSAFVSPKVQLYQQLKDGISKSVTMTAPEGWTVESQKVFPNQLVKAYNGREISINMNTIAFDIDNDTLETAIQHEIDHYREFASEFFSVEHKGIITVDEGKNVAIIKYLKGTADAAYIASAYIPERDFILCVTMATDYYQAFHASLPEFNTMVRSYRLIKEPVTASAKAKELSDSLKAVF